MGKENHVENTGRHKKPPRPPSPEEIWNISFPDSDSEQWETAKVFYANESFNNV